MIEQFEPGQLSALLATPAPAAAIVLAARTLVHPGYVPGRWYNLMFGMSSSTNSPAAGNIRTYPFLVTQTITISDMLMRVITASSGGKVQLAIYGSDPATKLPAGAVLANTGDLSTTAGGVVVTGSLVQGAVVLTPGLYWMALNCDTAGGTSQLQFATGAVAWASSLIGTATAANSIIATGTPNFVLSTAATFGSWPNASSLTFSEGNAPIPFAVVKVSAVGS